MTPTQSQPAPEQQYAYLTGRSEWQGFIGLLDSWVKSHAFNHIHYLARDEYREAFDHIFLMIGRLHKNLIAVRISDTGDGDDHDEIRLISENTKFKIRPI